MRTCPIRTGGWACTLCVTVVALGVRPARASNVTAVWERAKSRRMECRCDRLASQQPELCWATIMNHWLSPSNAQSSGANWASGASPAAPVHSLQGWALQSQ
jgi:hypothetical protein